MRDLKNPEIPPRYNDLQKKNLKLRKYIYSVTGYLSRPRASWQMAVTFPHRRPMKTKK